LLIWSESTAFLTFGVEKVADFLYGYFSLAHAASK
jgi:hypothetical protein